MTLTTRLRRTILHLRQIFFTEAITFMPSSYPVQIYLTLRADHP
jgi:hypothetical protein